MEDTNLKPEIKPLAVYSTEEVASILSLSQITVQRLINSEKIKGVKVGKNYKVTGLSIMEYINNSQKTKIRVRCGTIELGNHNYRFYFGLEGGNRLDSPDVPMTKELAESVLKNHLDQIQEQWGDGYEVVIDKKDIVINRSS